MKEHKFEEKGIWIKIDFDGDKVVWDSNEIDYRKWPTSIAKSYAKLLLSVSVNLPEQKKKENFFYAKAIVTKGRTFCEYLRGAKIPYTSEELTYINETNQQYENYFEKRKEA